MKADPGYFGPQSMMWKVNKEITVLFGGARALLMHAAHPLIAAGARQTSFYQRDPWKRLIRTLSLQNSVTFGTKSEADESAHRINKLHEVINGKDEVSGGYYDALDHLAGAIKRKNGGKKGLVYFKNFKLNSKMTFFNFVSFMPYSVLNSLGRVLNAVKAINGQIGLM